MNISDVTLREASESAAQGLDATATKAGAAAAAALKQVRERALDMSRQARALSREARDRARSEIVRRREDAADRLESFADAVRPGQRDSDRRRTMAIAGGSTLVLIAALGAGVAIGYYLNRRLQAKKAEVQLAKTQPAAAEPAKIEPGKTEPARTASAAEAAAMTHLPNLTEQGGPIGPG